VNAISNYLKPNMPLPQYLPYARFLLDTDLSHTAKLLYTLLLDRATLSQKNNWVDERGFVYVIFPISSLSEALRCSTMSIKRALRSLEDADLIERRRGRITVPNSIFVKVPTEQKCSFAWNDSALCDVTEMIPSTEQKCSTNQRNKNNLKDNHLIKKTAAHLTFGEYQNVFLTEMEYKRLKADFSGLDSLIEQLSAYIQSTGRKYADHAATLRIWAKRQRPEQKQAPGIPDYTFVEGESL
jgi:DNA-binding MarR family transcriptional regulator